MKRKNITENINKIKSENDEQYKKIRHPLFRSRFVYISLTDLFCLLSIKNNIIEELKKEIPDTTIMNNLINNFKLMISKIEITNDLKVKEYKIIYYDKKKEIQLIEDY